MEIIYPESKEAWLEARTKDITSTEVSALFGLSPYMTKFELWHRKKSGDVVSIKENERMKWGTILQDSIADGISKEQDWTIRRMEEYIRNPALKIGASFDFEAIKNEDIGKEGTKEMPTSFLLEIKNVDSLQFKNGWLQDEDGNIEAPLHIELQVQHQLMVSGHKVAYIGALVGGNRLELIKREWSPLFVAEIKTRVSSFWKSIDDNTPPTPDFERDAEFIKQLYKYAEPGKLLTVDESSPIPSLAEKYKKFAASAKEAEEQRKAIQAEILTLIGDAEKVVGPGFSISAGIVGESPRNFIMPAYRNCRIYWKGAK